MAEEKKTLSETLKELNKEFGENTVGMIKELDNIDIETISTGSYSLDEVLGNGGFPIGRIIEISGMESSGKSTLALHIVSMFQKRGLTCSYIDAEQSFSIEYSKKIGVDTDKLILCQPNNGEEGLTVVEKLVDTGELDLIVVDSVASLVPKKELEGELEKTDVALMARMLGKFLRRITANLAKKKTVLILLNQLRDKIGVFFGESTSSPGGRALKFFASIRLSVSKGDKIKKGEEVIGTVVKIEAKKNKTAPPFRKCELDIYFGKGIDLAKDLLNYATDKGIIKKEGVTYSYGETKLGIGTDKARNFLEENPDIIEKIRKEVDSLNKKDKQEEKKIKK